MKSALLALIICISCVAPVSAAEILLDTFAEHEHPIGVHFATTPSNLYIAITLNDREALQCRGILYNIRNESVDWKCTVALEGSTEIHALIATQDHAIVGGTFGAFTESPVNTIGAFIRAISPQGKTIHTNKLIRKRINRTLALTDLGSGRVAALYLIADYEPPRDLVWEYSHADLDILTQAITERNISLSPNILAREMKWQKGATTIWGTHAGKIMECSVQPNKQKCREIDPAGFDSQKVQLYQGIAKHNIPNAETWDSLKELVDKHVILIANRNSKAYAMLHIADHEKLASAETHYHLASKNFYALSLIKCDTGRYDATLRSYTLQFIQ